MYFFKDEVYTILKLLVGRLIRKILNIRLVVVVVLLNVLDDSLNCRKIFRRDRSTTPINCIVVNIVAIIIGFLARVAVVTRSPYERGVG